MTRSTSWRTLAVLIGTAAAVVGLVVVVRPLAGLSGGRAVAPRTTVTVSKDPTGDGCAVLPDGLPAGSETAARHDVEQLARTVLNDESASRVRGVGVGRCGSVWVVKVFVSDLEATVSLPPRGSSGTPLVPVLSGAFSAS